MVSTSEVYFMNTRATFSESTLTKLNHLFKQINLKINKNDIVAIKLHFGEPGNVSFIRPVWVREVVKWVKNLGGQPFLTDTNSLYSGLRSHSVDHIKTALSNGFDYACVQAPIIIADGLRGEAGVRVELSSHKTQDTSQEINYKHFQYVEIAQAAMEADVIIVLSHFKGHALTGFGGALKNIGMGLATRAGKYKMHINTTPSIKEGCKKCKLCLKWCAGKAIILKSQGPEIIAKKCLGCGQCLIVCPQKVFKIDWSAVSKTVFQERIVEFAAGALLNKKRASTSGTCFFNFILNVTPDCDCCPHSDANIVQDVGILASWDPVAIDKASVDLVNQQIGLGQRNGLKVGEDKFPTANWKVQLDYAEKLGLGSQDYRLIEV